MCGTKPWPLGQLPFCLPCQEPAHPTAPTPALPQASRRLHLQLLRGLGHRRLLLASQLLFEHLVLHVSHVPAGLGPSCTRGHGTRREVRWAPGGEDAGSGGQTTTTGGRQWRGTVCQPGRGPVDSVRSCCGGCGGLRVRDVVHRKVARSGAERARYTHPSHMCGAHPLAVMTTGAVSGLRATGRHDRCPWRRRVAEAPLPVC